jgi:transcriptional regulator with XRE-family HTH domain
MKYIAKYDPSKFKPLLTQLIKNAGYSARSFCEQFGLDRSMLIRAMNGRTQPDQETIERLSQILQCSLDNRRALYHSVGYLTPEELAAHFEGVA